MIRADELRKKEDSRNDLKKETYKKILSLINSKIKTASETNKKYIVYQVPSFIVGQPPYNVKSARKYIIRQLMLSGYRVCKQPDESLAITWLAERKKNPKPPTVPELPSLVSLRSIANQYRSR